MMSLLSVTVKKARFVGIQAQQFNTYVTLKLQNVKSTTVTVKGAIPCWEQDFLFETNNLDTGLLIEVWSKGMIWDRAIGYHWIPLQTIQYSNEEGTGQWRSLEAELVMRDGEVIGTKMPTGHTLLVDSRFELPFDPENIEAMDLQRKLEMLNNIMDQEGRVDNYRRMQYLGHSGYSEDSDYTSDLNYPVGPQHHANSSASQFRSAAYQIATPTTPQRSLETSRENSSERADTPNAPQAGAPFGSSGFNHSRHLSPDVYRRYNQHASNSEIGTNHKIANRGQHSRHPQETNIESEPLFYNSRPLNKSTYSSHENWMSCDSSAYNQSGDSFDVGLFMDANEFQHEPAAKYAKARRPSLERQSTLYDDCSFYDYPTSIQNSTGISSHHALERKSSVDEYYDVQPYSYQDERYGQEEEDRQWDSGGYDPYPAQSRSSTSKKLPPIPALQKPIPPSDCYSVYDEHPRPMSTGRRKMPQIPTKRTSWRQFAPEPSEGSRTPESYSHRGASLPPTPTKTTKMSSRLSQVLASNGRAMTPGRQLPKPVTNHSSARAKRNKLMKRTSSADYADNVMENDYVRTGAVSAMDYNEDYNYAYQSNDNLPAEADIYSANSVHMEQMNSWKEDYHSRSAQNNQTYYDVQIPVPQRKKLLGEIDSNFVQQNTDSLESRDDELKDFFETPVSSMSSSLQIIKSSAYPEPSVDLASPNITQKNILNAMSHQGELDQLRAMENSALSNLTVAQVHNHNSLGSNKFFMKQPVCVDDGYYLQGRLDADKTSQVEYGGMAQADAYLENQGSVESYVEEETEDGVVYGSNVGIGTAQAINHDSPLSVIHVESREDESQTLRSRESSQVSVVVDPFHSTAQLQQRQQQQVPVAASRRSSGTDTAYQNYNDTSLVYDDDDQFPTSYPRSKVVADTPEKLISEVLPEKETPALHEETAEQQPQPTKQLQEEEQTSEQRPKITAQQRWLWAYNKIIMQMDVGIRIIELDGQHSICWGSHLKVDLIRITFKMTFKIEFKVK